MVRKRTIELACAGVIGAGALFAAAAPMGEAQLMRSSSETSAMIMGPLLAEFGLGAAPSARVDGPSAALRVAEPAAAPAATSSRGEASRFAAAVINARSADADASAREGMDAVSAFSGRSAVIAESESGGRLSVAFFDAADPGLMADAFQSEYVEAGGMVLAGERPDRRAMAVRYEARFDAPGGFDGLDIGLAPRAGVSMSGAGAAAEAGATVRLGRYLGDYDGDERPAWWVFAGADRQALMFDPGEGFRLREAFAMEPYAIVGDAQAGVAMRFGPADLSVAYVHRETEFSMPNDSWETSEGFAAFTLSLRR